MSYYSKLSEKDVNTIKEKLNQNVSLAVIAKEFNVSPPAIFKIKHGISHKSLIKIPKKDFYHLETLIRNLTSKLSEEHTQDAEKLLNYINKIKLK